MISNSALRFITLASLLAALFFPIFAFNGLGSSQPEMFGNWQKDSDALVLGNMQLHSVQKTTEPYGLYVAYPDQMAVYALDGANAEQIRKADLKFWAYNSSLGLQGQFAAWTSSLGVTTVQGQKLLNAALLSVVFSVFVLQIKRITNPLFASVLALTAACSPWFVAAAGSLYWVPWTWYLPLVALAGFYFSDKRASRVSFGVLAFLAFVFRFGSGYEFLTTFALLGAALPLLAHFISGRGLDRTLQAALWESLKGFSISVSAFFVTLLWHATYRGSGNILEGLNSIIVRDVFRRTYGDPSALPEVFRASLESSPLTVLWTYLTKWETDFLVLFSNSETKISLGPQAPLILLVFAISITLVAIMTRSSLGREFGGALMISLLVWLSWYILGKSHSFIHVNINFILWYLLLAATIIYIPMRLIQVSVWGPLVGRFKNR